VISERGSQTLRILDRWIGIPLVYVLSIFRRMFRRAPTFKEQKRGQRVALLVTSGIGDLVLVSSLVRALQQYDPEGSITIFAGRSNKAMAEMLWGVDVVILPITAPWSALPLLRSKKFDTWIDCNPWPRLNSIFSFFAYASLKIGFKTKGQFRHGVYDIAIEHKETVHELDNMRQLLHPLGIDCRVDPFILSKGKRRKNQKIALHLFAAGASRHLKEWPLEKWFGLTTFLLSQHISILLTGSPVDGRKLRSYPQFDHPLIDIAAGKLSLEQTADLLTSCLAVVTIDTGIMHLAASMGCPTICLHGPTSPLRWGAIGPNVIVIRPKLSYIPCISLGFERQCKKALCMSGITVCQVIEALQKHQLL